MSQPRATMQMNHSTPKKTVMRSRFRSTTDDEPSVEDTPPPKRSDRPPPLPLCRRTSRIITRLVMIRMTDSAISTLLPSPSTLRLCQRTARGQLTIPANRDELAGVQAGAAHEGAVHVLLRHDGRNVVAFNGPAIQDTHRGAGFGTMTRRNVRP